MGVPVELDRKAIEHFHIQAGFFPTLARRGVGRCFVLLDFASGEFPKALQRGSRWPRADKVVPIRFDNGQGNWRRVRWSAHP
jgi:hypothetical protein